jgi:hypothetical protein
MASRIGLPTIPAPSVCLMNIAPPASLAFGIYVLTRSVRAHLHRQRIIMADYRVSPGQVHEDQITASIEKHTSQIPSSAYLALAVGAMAISAGFHLARKEHPALFVGQWAAPFLLLGIYNKLVKQHGSDAASRSLQPTPSL